MKGGYLASLVFAILLLSLIQSPSVILDDSASDEIESPELTSRISTGLSAANPSSGTHLFTGESWQPSAPFRVTVTDWDGDGMGNSVDDFPTDPALPSIHSGVSTTCLSHVHPCYEPAIFDGETTPIWTYTSSTNSQAAKWGDFDGDGDLDLAFARADGSEQVFENVEGKISEEPVWSSASSDSSWDLEWGDMDGDADLDLAVGIDGRNKVYLNDNGVLRTTATWTSTDNDDTNDVDWADMDGDGDLDLVACNNGAPVQIYRNTGTTLERSSYWQTSQTGLVYDCDIGDVNGDGRMDLVVGWNGDPMSLHLNSASGLSTTQAWTSASSGDVKDVALGDVDSDGDLDLFVANKQDVDSLYLNDGSTFATTPTWSTSAVTDTFDVDWGDVDGDGDLDIAIGTAVTNRILLNVGVGPSYDYSEIFQEDEMWTSLNSVETESIEFGDVDGDGDLDIVTANWGSGHELFRNPTSAIPADVSATLSTSPTVYGIEMADLDGDGILEIISAIDGANQIHQLVSGTWQLTWSSSNTFDSGDVQFADVDGDGDLDMAFANYGSPNTIYLNSAGTFGNTANWSSSDSKDSMAVAWGNFNGDSHPDLAFGNEGERNQVFLNDGTGGFSTGGPDWTSSDFEMTYGLDVADIDGNGYDDLIVGNTGNNQIHHFNAGVGTTVLLPRSASWTSTDNVDTNAVKAGDFDNDGDLDLLSCGYSEKGAIHYNNGGVLAGSPGWMTTNVMISYDCTFADMNGDGSLDVLFANYNQKNSLHLNSGGVVNPSPDWATQSAYSSYGLYAGDLEGDGDMDLVFGNAAQASNIFYGMTDFDGDWISAEEDEMQYDPTQAFDLDGDGFGDSITGRNADSCTGLWGDSWRDRIGCPDLDSDGQSDLNDPFMQQISQWSDIDNDGFGDNWKDGTLNASRLTRGLGEYRDDAFLPDESPWDYDNDGYEDQTLSQLGANIPFDACPHQAGESYRDRDGCKDSDLDGWSDAGDEFPGDSTQWNDTDEDGFGDNPKELNADRCPTVEGYSTEDRLGCPDIDGDGWSDINDFSPDNILVWSDEDRDGFDDQISDDCVGQRGSSTEDRSGCPDNDRDGWSDSSFDWLAHPAGLADAFDGDESQYRDIDGDGFGNNLEGNQPDSCMAVAGDSTIRFVDNESIAWFGCPDDDGDGIENNSDDCPISAGTSWLDSIGCLDSDGDGISDTVDDCDLQAGDSTIGFVGCFDTDGDGIPDSVDPNPNNASGTASDWDGDGYGVNDSFPSDSTQWADDDGDGLGDNPNGTSPDPYPGDSDNDGYADDNDSFPNDATEWFDMDGDGIGDNRDSDKDGDGYPDVLELRDGTDPMDVSSHPVESWELLVPGTSIGLGAWDMIGVFGGGPVFVWLAFGMVTRGRRSSGFEREMVEAKTRQELENIAKRYERALMLRILGVHQGIRLERLRAEFDDLLELQGQSLPPQGVRGVVDDSGYEWIKHEGKNWFRHRDETEWAMHEL